MKNKILAIWLMILTFFSVSVSALAEPTITVESVNVKNEKTAEVKIFIKNNPGMWGMDLRIGYDKTKLTLTKVENGSVFASGEWMEGNLNGEQYILSYARNDFQDTKNNGLLATLTFDIINPDVSGSYDITASYKAGDVINVNFGEIAFKIINGKVTVAKKAENLQKTDAPADNTPATSAPQLNTFEAVLTTDVPIVTDAPATDKIMSETPKNDSATSTQQPTAENEETPLFDDYIESAPKDDNTFIILVGALIIGFAFYYLIKRKKNK